MASLNYDEIYSRFFTKVEAFDFVHEEMPDELIAEYMSTWLRSAISYPNIRKLFSSIVLDEENECFDYELRYKMDKLSDAEFVLEILAYGMLYSWLEPKVRSITNIYQNFTSSESKFYSQSQHLSELRALLSDAELRIRSLIRDRGYYNNTYLDGRS